jgi:hypothetical protein
VRDKNAIDEIEMTERKIQKEGWRQTERNKKQKREREREKESKKRERERERERLSGWGWPCTKCENILGMLVCFRHKNVNRDFLHTKKVSFAAQRWNDWKEVQNSRLLASDLLLM